MNKLEETEYKRQVARAKKQPAKARIKTTQTVNGETKVSEKEEDLMIPIGVDTPPLFRNRIESVEELKTAVDKFYESYVAKQKSPHTLNVAEIAVAAACRDTWEIANPGKSAPKINSSSFQPFSDFIKSIFVVFGLDGEVVAKFCTIVY